MTEPAVTDRSRMPAGLAGVPPPSPIGRLRATLTTVFTRWWVWPVLVFSISRLIAGLMIVHAQRFQIPITDDVQAAGYFSVGPRVGEPGYLDVATNWDAQWYWHIADEGYPTQLPLDGSSKVERNAWAFPPLFPAIVRLVMSLTGLDFPVVAVLIATLCSAVGVVLVYRLIDETAGRNAARVTSLLLCTAMAAPAFQIAYTEGPALLLLTAALTALRRQRYGLTALAVLAMGLTRHVVLPFLLVVVVHFFLRQRETWRERSSDRRSRLRPAALVASTLIAAFAWPAIAAIVTGRLTAFTDTQAAWRKSDEIGPLGLFSVAWHYGGPPALVLALAVVGVFAVIVLRPAARRWSPELRTWGFAYPVYLMAVAPAAVSLFRFWLLAFPLAWVFPSGLGRSKMQYVAVGVLAAAGLAAQWFWIRNFLILGPVEQQFAMP